MNVKTDFPVAGRVKLLHNGVKAYEGIVAMHPYNRSLPAIRIEQANRQQLTFIFFVKLNGEEGWALVPDPLPKGYAFSQDAMLLSIERE